MLCPKPKEENRYIKEFVKYCQAAKTLDEIDMDLLISEVDKYAKYLSVAVGSKTGCRTAQKHLEKTKKFLIAGLPLREKYRQLKAENDYVSNTN